MKNKSPLTKGHYIALTIALVFIFGSSIAYASQFVKIDLSKADEYVNEQIAKKKALLGEKSAPSEAISKDVYEELANEASLSGAKREALLGLRNKNYHGMKNGQFLREAYIAVGKLSGSQKRITLEQACEILQSKGEGTTWAKQFVNIAGAPDILIMNIDPSYIFFLDESGDNAIWLNSSYAKLITYDSKGNKKETDLVPLIAKETAAAPT